MAIARLLSGLNRSRLWRWTVRVGRDRLKAPSLDRLVYLWLHRWGLMGAGEHRALAQLVQPGMRIVDIGANIGLYTLLLARLAGPEGRVYSFEPEPELFRALRTNCLRNHAANVLTRNCALGESTGRVAFYRSVFNGGDNRLGEFGWRSEAVAVDLVRLDDALPDLHVDFIKLDVQGYEMSVLRGMDRVLARNPRLEVLFELWPYGLARAGTDPEKLLAHLRDHGFRIFLPQSGALQQVSGFEELRPRLPGKRFTDLLASRWRVAGPLAESTGGLRATG